MFDKSLLQIRNAARDAYYSPERYDKYSTDIVYKVSHTSWNTWENTFDEWLPRFEEAGWLDDLNRIEVGNVFIDQSNDGEYEHSSRTIRLGAEISIDRTDEFVGHTHAHVLIHEMLHHVHMKRIWDGTRGPTSNEIAAMADRMGWTGNSHTFDIYVSKYASKNFLEAVAETGTGLIIGEEYPDDVIDIYQSLNGPEPI